MPCYRKKTGGCKAIVNSICSQGGSREVIVSTSGCQGCQACMHHCPVNKAHTDTMTIQNVTEQGCIGCGACLSQCPQQAIDYQDDIELFLRDLSKGRPISLLVAPAVQRHFRDYRQVFGFLKALGVQKFYSVLLRADITLWAYVQILRNQNNKPFISSPCAAVTDFIMNYASDLRTYLMPVYSPLVCTAIFLKKYRSIDDHLAFLSPCIAKRAELRRSGQKVRYSVTIGRLKQYLSAAGIDLSQYQAVDFTDSAEGQGLTLAANGDIVSSLRQHIPEGLFRKISGCDQVYRYLTEYAVVLKTGEQLPTLLEVYNCESGCDSGPGVGSSAPGVLSQQLRNDGLQHQVEVAFKNFSNHFDLTDFIWPEISG